MERELSKIDLIQELWKTGLKEYLRYKIRSTLRKPDMDAIFPDLYIGGETTGIPDDFTVINLRNIPEAIHHTKEMLKQIDKYVDKINNNLVTGHKVFAHCRHGRGRAPIVACCYLIKYKKSQKLH